MTAPRRPAAGRRPATSRGRSGRTSRSTTARSGRPTPPVHDSRRTGLTHRAAVLGLVVTTLVLSAALPLREYLDQRSSIAELEQEADSARTRVAELLEAKRQLEDPAHITAEARRRLHMTRPGEVTYVLITPPPVPAATQEPAPGGPGAPWWSQVWGSVESADRPPDPEAPAAPAPAPPPPPPEPAPAPPPP